MTAAVDAFHRRLAAELAAARHALADVLEEPCPIARRTIGDATLRRTQPLYRLSDGVVAHAGEAEADAGARPLTAREVLEHVETHAATIAEREARALELAADLLAHDDEERRDFVQRAPASWPWSAWIGFRGNDLLPLLVMLVADVAEARDGTPWPATPDEDVPEWAAEAIARRDEQAATSYRARAEHGFTNIELRGELVVLDQVAALYALLPAAVRDARATRRYVLRVAAGDEHRALGARVAHVLATEKAADTEEARDLLAGRTRRHHVGAIAHAAKLAERAPPRTVTDAAELFDALTETFATHVERDDKALAEHVRGKDHEERRRWWRDDKDRWLTTIARHTWKHEGTRAIAQRPALVYQVHDDVARIHTRTSVLEERDGQQRFVYDNADPVVLVASAGLAEIVTRGALLLGSVTAHRLLRWEIATGHAQALRGDADPRVITVDGGWSVLAGDVLGIKAKNAGDDVRAIMHAQQAIHFQLPTGRKVTGLVVLDETPARGRRRGRIEIMLGSMLLPHFVHEIAGVGRDASDARRLVPVLRELPPMVGRPREHGALASLSMFVMRELRIHARELAETGAVEISPARWEALAREASLPLVTLRLALERWIRDCKRDKDGKPKRDKDGKLEDYDDTPAFLHSPAGRPNAYTLGATHAAELAFIVAAGHTSARASRGGRKSVETRTRKRLGRQ